jgi:hypothetical protein
MFAAINAMHGLGLAAGALSSLFWTLAYALIIRRGARDRTFGMPLVALAANLSWEAIFLCKTIALDGADARLALILPWTLLDVAIAVQCFRYGPADFSDPRLRRWFPFALAGIIGFAAAVILSIVRELGDAIGWYAAFGQNLLMSALFVAMLLRRGDVRGQSPAIALCKLLGTWFAFVLALFWSPPTLHEHWATLLPARYTPIAPLLVTLYAGIFALDVVYLTLLVDAYRTRGLSPWRRT